MDLRSANEGASWHPLSMLISFESRAEGRELYFLPLQEYPAGKRWSSRLERHSTELHEVTHVWCARTSRLGLLLIRTAAEHFAAWQENRSTRLRLPERIHRFLGAYVPVLEGLALYAQLDFEAEQAGSPIPTPLTTVLQLAPFVFENPHLSLADCFRIVGHALRDEPICGDDNLLQKLLLGNEDAQNHYFYGYLYVKSIQAFWSQACPDLTRPDLFLPLVVRVLCDHTVAERALSETLREEEILDQVHGTVLSMREHLPSFLRLLRTRPDFAASFDHWDLPAHLARGSWDEPLFYNSEIERRFFTDTSGPLSDVVQRWAPQIGNSASLHLLDWRGGELLEVLADGSAPQARVRMRCADQEIAIDLPFLAHLYARGAMGAKELADPERREQVSTFMLFLEIHFLERLKEHLRQSVTLAMFLTLTHGNTGVAFWAGGKLQAWYLMTDGPMVDLTERDIIARAERDMVDLTEREKIARAERKMIVRGLGIPPEDRQSFGRAFTDRAEIERCIVAGRSVLLDKLVSDERARAILGQRFNFLVPDHVPALREWCAFHPSIQRYPPLPEALLAAVRPVFDLPGFPGLDRETFSLAHMLPSLPPGVIARPPQSRRSNGV